MMQQPPTPNESNSHDSVVDTDARLEPTAKDIVFGRGKKYQDHEGNKRMRQCVNEYKQLYNALKRFQKQTLVETIYDKLVEGGARFLRKDEATNTWVLVERELATQKVSHALRCKKHLGKQSSVQKLKKSASPARKDSSSSTIDTTSSARGDLASIDSHKKRMQVIEPTSETSRSTPAMNPILSPKAVVAKAGLPTAIGSSNMVPQQSMAAGGAPGAPSVAALHALQTLQMQDMLQRQRLLAMMDMQRQAQQQAVSASAYYNAAMNQILAQQNKKASE